MLTTTIFKHHLQAELNHELIDTWFQQKFQGSVFPFYTSVDLRVSDFKVSVVDTNLYPGGFNNLCDFMIEQAAQSVKAYMTKYYPFVQRITMFCEGHTRNFFYFDNLKALGRMFKFAGFDLSYYHPAIEGTIDGLIFKNIHLVEADLIIANNDFSNGYPELLDSLGIPVIPQKKLAWVYRRKSNHFRIVNELAMELGEIAGIDPWLVTSIFDSETKVDLKDLLSIHRLKLKASVLFDYIQLKYQFYNITETPTLFIKDDSGTYGMGIMTITHPEDLDHLNRKALNKMAVGKQHVIENLVLQEGVPSHLKFHGATAEPVVYCVNDQLVGAFLRVNHQRDKMANLNSQGMEFYRVCNQKMGKHNLPSACVRTHGLGSYGVIAVKLALLAAAMENSL